MTEPLREYKVKGRYTEEELRRTIEKERKSYCAAFETWIKIVREKAKNEEEPFNHNWAEVLKNDHLLEIAIRKSNLLFRMIYLGEPLRTRECPKHKGRWSGYGWDGAPCECQMARNPVKNEYAPGYDITGWLPET